MNHIIESLMSRFFPKNNMLFIFEGKKLDLKHPIYFEDNEFFFPLCEFICFMGGNIEVRDAQVHIKADDNDITFDIFNCMYKIKFLNNCIYLSFKDITSLLNLKVRWNYENNEVFVERIIKKTY